MTAVAVGTTKLARISPPGYLQAQKKSKQLHSTATEHDKCTQHARSVNDHVGRWAGWVGGGRGLRCRVEVDVVQVVAGQNALKKPKQKRAVGGSCGLCSIDGKARNSGVCARGTSVS